MYLEIGSWFGPFGILLCSYSFVFPARGVLLSLVVSLVFGLGVYFLSRFSSPVHSCKIACKIRWLINKKNSNIKKKKLFSKHFNQKKMI
ncbi:hypothetical protein V1519DRAFT_445125, partial [Lipomyces tetrasporus]